MRAWRRLQITVAVRNRRGGGGGCGRGPAVRGPTAGMRAAPAGPRRQGLARLLLRGAEELCAARGFRHICLHARLQDAPALALYAGAGYQEVQRDSVLVRLRGIMPRALLRKEVPPLAPHGVGVDAAVAGQARLAGQQH